MAESRYIWSPSRMKKSYILWCIACVVCVAMRTALNILTRSLDAYMLPYQQFYIRIFIWAILMYVLLYKKISRKRIIYNKKDTLLACARGLIFVVWGILLYLYAVIETKLWNVAAIAAIPVMSVLWFLINKESTSYKKSIYILISVIWVLCIWLRWWFTFGFGELCVLLSTLGVWLWTISAKRQSWALNNYEITLIFNTMWAIWVYIASLVLWDNIPYTAIPNAAWIYLTIWGVLATMSTFLMNYGMSNVYDTTWDLLFSTELLRALIIWRLLYSEIPTNNEWIGIILISIASIGIVCTNKPQNK